MDEFGPALLLFAVAGYVTLRHCANRTKFRSAALAWEQNVFESGALGLSLFLIARLILVATSGAATLPMLAPVAAPLWGGMQGVAHLIGLALPFKFSASLIAAFMLGIGGGLLTNLRWSSAEAVGLAVRDYGGDLRIFLHEMAAKGAPVALTLKNRKVYVGFVRVPPALEDPAYVTLLRTLSGYRDGATLQLIFTTSYEHVYEDLEKRPAANEDLSIDIEGFQIVLPLNNVDSANSFDGETYTQYFAAPDSAGVPRSK